MPYVRRARASALALAAVILSVSVASNAAPVLAEQSEDASVIYPSGLLSLPVSLAAGPSGTVSPVPQMTADPTTVSPPVPAAGPSRATQQADPAPVAPSAGLLQGAEAIIAEAQAEAEEAVREVRDRRVKQSKAAKENAQKQRAAARAREAARLRALPWQKREGFQWPAKGWVTSHFGPRRSGFHHGIDIACKRGSQIRAAKRGTVLMSRALPVYGKTVVIQHPGGYSTLYAHMQRVHVRAGRQVRDLQLIGKCGSTGFSTGPHLHFELRRNGTFLKPGHFLP